MPKLYDGFAFFNELDLLDIRLKELYDVVDHFIIVEATRTFQKNPKPLYYLENKDRFKQYADKIIHVVVDKYPNFFTKFRVPHAWDYDNHQKEFILKGLVNAAPDDVVIVSDVDELPLRSKVLAYKDSPKTCVFEQYFNYYFLNSVCTHSNDAPAKLNRNGFGYWRGPVMIRRKNIQSIKKTRMMRDLDAPEVTIIENGGWHFSWLGGIDTIIKKIEAWTHPEYNTAEMKNRAYIESSIRAGKSIFDPNTTFKLIDLHNTDLELPVALRENPEKYNHLIFK